MILRIDDINAHTHPKELIHLYEHWWNAGRPICFSVIPMSAYDFQYNGIQTAEVCDIRNNLPLVKFLAELEKENLVEIASHGLYHHYGELAAVSEEAVLRRISESVTILRSVFERINVVVPPHDFLSTSGVRAIQSHGLRVCSTWAALHGCTRYAHVMGRIRKLLGHTSSQLMQGLATELSLDFDDGEDAESILHLRANDVIVQHYWQILEGRQNELWHRWVERSLKTPMQVKRYRDVFDNHNHT